MKTINILFMLLVLGLFSCVRNTGNESTPSIEVTGSAEMEIEPDEISLIMGIGEYWEEEFQAKTAFKDYRTKKPIAEIEPAVLKDLYKMGVKKEDIVVREAGNYWRYHGKEFLVSKVIEIKLTDFEIVNKIFSGIDRKGIDYLRIGQLKNKDILNYRKQVKIEALKAAREKAEYLVSSLGKKVGEVISIVEMNDGSDRFSYASTNMLSNVALGTPNEDEGLDDIRKIKLRYEIQAKFEIY